MFGLSYWILPLISAAAWFGTLLAMLIVWLAQGRPHYSSMEPNQTIAFISDIGATGLKPLFIAGSTVSVVIFTLTFISERWLRHKGRLAHNTSNVQKALSICAVLASIVGTAGLILLTIFDTRRHPQLHRVFLGLFIGGFIVAAAFICAEYQRLGVIFREHSILRTSFWVKLAFILIEIALVVAFGVLQTQDKYNAAGVLEWVISLVYILFVASFVMDFIPAVKSKHNRFPTKEEMRQLHAQPVSGEPNGPSVSGGPTYSEPHSDRPSNVGTYDSSAPLDPNYPHHNQPAYSNAAAYPNVDQPAYPTYPANGSHAELESGRGSTVSHQPEMFVAGPRGF